MLSAVRCHRDCSNWQSSAEGTHRPRQAGAGRALASTGKALVRVCHVRLSGRESGAASPWLGTPGQRQQVCVCRERP